MQISKILGLALVGAVAFGFASDANAISVSGVGLMTRGAPSFEPAVTNLSSPLGFGFGALAAFGVAPGFEAETGLLFAPTVFGQGDPATERKFQQVQIPLLLRFTAAPMVSVGAGGYYAMNTGDLETTPAGGTTTTQPLENTNIGGSDLGLVGSVGVNFSLAPMVSFLVDARYLLGLKDWDERGGADVAKTRQLQVLAGVSVGF